MDRNISNRLIIAGILLFLFGLIIGLFVPIFANPRMGVSSHTQGILNGMFLVILGLIWNKLQLSERWLNITYWFALYGTFANWFAILIAAIFNAGKMLNFAANGKEGNAFVEIIITFLLVTLSIAMIVVCIAILIGLKKNQLK